MKRMIFEHNLKKISKKFLFSNFKKLGIKKNDTIYFGLDIRNFYEPFFKILKQSSGFEKNTHEYLIGYNKSELYMNGSKVYGFVTSKVVPNLESFINKTNQKISKIYIHQASKLVIDTFKEKFRNYDIEFPTNLTKYGNTNASTI
ncbi:hypothetical protein OA868_03210, partial [Candidatus Pelagibacter sp.]|nr:hypothetical protein [Candidatus Pelagibacter sp.]